MVVTELEFSTPTNNRDRSPLSAGRIERARVIAATIRGSVVRPCTPATALSACYLFA
jgi:hypothetical protein